MLNPSSPQVPPKLSLILKDKLGRLKVTNFDEPGNRAEKIMGILVMKYATGSTKKNFLQRGKEYEIEFEGETLKVIPRRDIFIISKKKKALGVERDKKQEVLDLSVRFFANEDFGEKEKLGVGAFGTVRRLSEEKCHISFSDDQPIAVKKEARHRKVVKEVQRSAAGPVSLAEENRLFGLVHGIGSGTRGEVYTDLNSTSRMVMHEFEGDTLNKINIKDLPFKKRLNLTSSMAKQIKKVHELGYVISDVKLENFVYLTAEEETRIIDTAFFKEGYKGPMILTYYTRSPESFAYFVAQFSSDIYSSGVVFASILAGKSYGAYIEKLYLDLCKKDPNLTVNKFMIDYIEGKYPGYSIQDFIKQIKIDHPEAPQELIDWLLKAVDKDQNKRPELDEIILTINFLNTLKEELSIGYEHYKGLPQDFISFPSMNIKNISDWCVRVKKLIGNNPSYGKISEEISLIQTKLDELKQGGNDNKLDFSQKEQNTAYVSFSDKLKSFFEMINSNYPQFKEGNKDTKPLEEVVEPKSEVFHSAISLSNKL